MIRSQRASKLNAHVKKKIMTNEAKERKQQPVKTGVLDYFPDAIRAVAHCSGVGNEQHNPGSELHWDRAKS